MFSLSSRRQSQPHFGSFCVQEVPHPPAAVRRRGRLALRAAGLRDAPHPHRGEAAARGPARRHPRDAEPPQRALQDPGRRLGAENSRGVTVRIEGGAGLNGGGDGVSRGGHERQRRVEAACVFVVLGVSLVLFALSLTWWTTFSPRLSCCRPSCNAHRRYSQL